MVNELYCFDVCGCEHHVVAVQCAQCEGWLGARSH
jgi:hypothetical protein